MPGMHEYVSICILQGRKTFIVMSHFTLEFLFSHGIQRKYNYLTEVLRKLAATDSSLREEWHSLQGDPVELKPPRGHCNQS